MGRLIWTIWAGEEVCIMNVAMASLVSPYVEPSYNEGAFSPLSLTPNGITYITILHHESRNRVLPVTPTACPHHAPKALGAPTRSGGSFVKLDSKDYRIIDGFSGA